jgi:hypothetical protein
VEKEIYRFTENKFNRNIKKKRTRLQLVEIPCILLCVKLWIKHFIEMLNF